MQQFELKLFWFKPGLSFSLFNCIHKKLCTIWCRRYRFDLWSNTCPYLSICTVLIRSNSPKLWMARVCNSKRVSLTFFFEIFRGKTADEGVGKEPLSEEFFFFDWAENISTIDLVVEANFSNSLLRFLSRFSVVDKPHPLTPRKYPPASSFQTGLKLSTSNCTPSSLFSNPSFVLSPPPLSTSEFSSSELRSPRLDSSTFDSSELDSDWGSSCSSQKSSSSLFPQKSPLPLIFLIDFSRFFTLSGGRSDLS